MFLVWDTLSHMVSISVGCCIRVHWPDLQILQGLQLQMLFKPPWPNQRSGLDRLTTSLYMCDLFIYLFVYLHWVFHQILVRMSLFSIMTFDFLISAWKFFFSAYLNFKFNMTKKKCAYWKIITRSNMNQCSSQDVVYQKWIVDKVNVVVPGAILTKWTSIRS